MSYSNPNPNLSSLRKQPTFGDVTTGFPAKWHLRNERRNSIRIARHYPDLGSSSDWLNQICHAAWPIRCTTQTWVVMHHQYGNSCAHFSFRGETSSGNAKSQLFSQAIPWGTSFPFYPSRFCGSTLPMTWYPWSMTLYLWPMTYTHNTWLFCCSQVH